MTEMRRKYCAKVGIATSAIGLVVCNVALAGPPLKGGIATPGSTVIDGNGTVVGTLLSSNVVEINKSGAYIAAIIRPDGFLINGSVTNLDTIHVSISVYYQNTSCTGTAFVKVNTLPPWAVTIAVPSKTGTGFAASGTLYYPDMTNYQIRPMKAVASVLANITSWPPTVPAGHCLPDEAPVYSAPVLSANIGPFTLPFKIQ